MKKKDCPCDLYMERRKNIGNTYAPMDACNAALSIVHMCKLCVEKQLDAALEIINSQKLCQCGDSAGQCNDGGD